MGVALIPDNQAFRTLRCKAFILPLKRLTPTCREKKAIYTDEVGCLLSASQMEVLEQCCCRTTLTLNPAPEVGLRVRKPRNPKIWTGFRVSGFLEFRSGAGARVASFKEKSLEAVVQEKDKEARRLGSLGFRAFVRV